MKLFIAFGIILIVGIIFALSLNIGKPKDQSNEELMTLFRKNKTPFSLVAQGFENQKSGFWIDLHTQDIDKMKESSGFSKEVLDALKSLKKLQIVNVIAVDERGVTFEIGYVDKTHRGSYIYSHSDLELNANSPIYKIEDGWYLEVIPNT